MPARGRLRLCLWLVIAKLILLVVPEMPASAEVAAAPPSIAAGAAGVAPQFLRDLPDLQGLIDGDANFVVGGGYLYWARCRVVDTGGAYYLRRWPLAGGRAITLQNSSFCALSTASADETGLYYWANGAIVRRSVSDPLTVETLAASPAPSEPIVLDNGTTLWRDYIFWLASNTLYSADRYTFERLAPPEPLGNNAHSVLFADDGYFYWFADGVTKKGLKTCLAFGGGACIKQVWASEDGAALIDATVSYSLDGSRNPLWVRADNLGINGNALRGYGCTFISGGNTCGASTQYTAPTRGSTRGAIGPLATDGNYLFWIENTVGCSTFGCSVNPNDGAQLMKWYLKPSIFSPGPFDAPQPIVTTNSGGAAFTIGGLGLVVVANGWVYFTTSNGISRIRADAPPISWNFAADSYEMTQGLQNLNNDVPLVADKPTFVRFYGRKLDGPDAYGVEALLYGARANGAALPGSPLHPINGSQDFTANNANPDRLKPGNSWLFQLPPEWLSAGSIKLSPQIDPRQGWNDPNRSNNALPDRTFSFTRKAPICIVTIPVRTHAPAASNRDPSLFRMADITRQLLPTSDVWIYHQDNDVAQLEARVGIPPWKYEPYAVPAKGDNILRSLWLRDALSDDPDRCDSAGARTHYVGLMHAQTPTNGNLGKGYTPGAQLYIKLIDPATLSTTPRFWERQEFNTLAHELSHNYGRQHVNCGSPANPDSNYPYVDKDGTNCLLDDGRRSGSPIAAYQRYYGFDTTSLTPIDPGATADYMAYRAPFWVSDYTWRAVFGGIQAAAARQAAPMEAQTRTQAQLAAAANVVYLTGSIEPAANAGSLDYAWVYPTTGMSQGMLAKLQRSAAPEAGGAAPQADSGYSVRLRDAAGTLIDERAITLQVTSDADSSAKPFALTFPAPDASVARLELTSGGIVIAALQPGGKMPTVSLLSPAGGETIDKEMQLSWRASDPDTSDMLLFTVQYSPDNGAHWRTLLTAFPTPSGGDTTTLDLSQLSGMPGSTSGGRIRVAASDGYNTAIAISPPFTVTPRSPEPYINAPGHEPLPAGQPVIARGGATDAADGGLTGAALRWTLDGQDIGMGAQQTLNGLAPGSYELALTALNTAGKTATVTTTFTIAPLAIPLASAPTLDGVCSDRAYASAARVALAPYNDDAQASVRLVRSADALWVCFTGMKRTNGSSPGTMAAIRIDANNSRDATPQPGDYLFTLGEDGTLKSYNGNGGGYNTSGPGGANGYVSASGGVWTAELRISASTIGGWNRVIGLDVEQAWVGAIGDDYFWPHSARWNSPRTWAMAALGDLPQVAGLAPQSAPVGAGNTTLIVNGSGFANGATILWNGAPRATTVVSPTQLRASVGAADLTVAGVAWVAAANPGLQAAPSNVVPFTIFNPLPRIDQLTLAGKTLRVSGSGYVNGATVIWNGVERPATLVSDGLLQVELDNADLLDVGTIKVTVCNPGPGGGVSNVATLNDSSESRTIFLPLMWR